MKVYTLLYVTGYGGSDLLGVYSSLERAKEEAVNRFPLKAGEAWTEHNWGRISWSTDWVVEEREVDAPGAWSLSL